MGSSKGFTLLEILVVFAVLSAINVLVLGAINPIEQRNKAKDAKLKTETAEIYKAFLRGYASGELSPLSSSVEALPLNSQEGAQVIQNLVNSEELKTAVKTSDDLSKIYLTSDSSLSDVKLCYQPSSSVAKNDPKNTYNIKGEQVDNCGPTGCYTCVGAPRNAN